MNKKQRKHRSKIQKKQKKERQKKKKQAEFLRRTFGALTEERNALQRMHDREKKRSKEEEERLRKKNLEFAKAYGGNGKIISGVPLEQLSAFGTATGRMNDSLNDSLIEWLKHIEKLGMGGAFHFPVKDGTMKTMKFDSIPPMTKDEFREQYETKFEGEFDEFSQYKSEQEETGESITPDERADLVWKKAVDMAVDKARNGSKDVSLDPESLKKLIADAISDAVEERENELNEFYAGIQEERDQIIRELEEEKKRSKSGQTGGTKEHIIGKKLIDFIERSGSLPIDYVEQVLENGMISSVEQSMEMNHGGRMCRSMVLTINEMFASRGR